MTPEEQLLHQEVAGLRRRVAELERDLEFRNKTHTKLKSMSDAVSEKFHLAWMENIEWRGKAGIIPEEGVKKVLANIANTLNRLDPERYAYLLEGSNTDD